MLWMRLILIFRWFLWSLIDNRRKSGVKADYLQVFELTVIIQNNERVQKVVHSQECPAISDTYFIPVIEQPVKTKIWAMDNQEYCTMMFPHEY